MALLDRQVQVRDLVMGPGTDYQIVEGFNPFNRDVRVEQSEARTHAHGSWSGTEFNDEVTVPIRILIQAPDQVTWLQLHDRLMHAFRPVGRSFEEVQLRFSLGGQERVMFGRPRMVEPNLQSLVTGEVAYRAAFVALDPFQYSSEPIEHDAIGLPVFRGGLLVSGATARSRTLNSNTGFETDTSGWDANGGTVTRSTAQAYIGSASGLFEPDGTTATPLVGFSAPGWIAVNVGDEYEWPPWVYSPDALSGVEPSIAWLDSADNVVSEDVGDSVSLSAGKWTKLLVTATAPTNAAKASGRVRITGTPASTVDLHLDEARFMYMNTGGFTVPFAITGRQTEGRVKVANDGTAETGMTWRISGPVAKPKVAVQYQDGGVNMLSFDLDIPAGQYLDVDTHNRTVLLNGRRDRRGRVEGDWPLLPNGDHLLRWTAATISDSGSLSVSYRHKWR